MPQHLTGKDTDIKAIVLDKNIMNNGDPILSSFVPISASQQLDISSRALHACLGLQSMFFPSITVNSSWDIFFLARSAINMWVPHMQSSVKSSKKTYFGRYQCLNSWQQCQLYNDVYHWRLSIFSLTSYWEMQTCCTCILPDALFTHPIINRLSLSRDQ